MRRRTFLQSALTPVVAAAIPSRALFASPFLPADAAARAGQAASDPMRDVEALTGDGKRVTLSGKSIADLRARLRGRVLLRGADGYDDARRILNPSFDKYPALVAQVTGVADIRAAVDFARDNGGLLTAVKCGGHSFSGASTCDGGLQIDLSRFRDVRVDPIARRAWVTGGSLLGHVDHEAMSHDLVTPLGTVSHTGVGGLVTGGGFGRVARRFGLAVDNLLSVQVVTADGKLVRASADENPDLFWGVRGGGGNFGIVTSFEFRLHPMQRRVVNGSIVYPASKARETLAILADYAPKMPDELNLHWVMDQPQGGKPGVVLFDACYSGPENQAERALAPLRKLGAPIADTIKAMDYVAVQRSGDVTDPRAVGMYLKSGFIDRFSPGLIAAAIDRFEGDPQRSTTIVFVMGGGVPSRVPANATAFVQRDCIASLLAFVAWKHGDDPTPHTQWIRKYWSGVEPHTHGFYVNDLTTDDTPSAIQANYRQNHTRLVQVKTKYDPKNLFRLNANVTPSALKS